MDALRLTALLTNLPTFTSKLDSNMQNNGYVAVLREEEFRGRFLHQTGGVNDQGRKLMKLCQRLATEEDTLMALHGLFDAMPISEFERVPPRIFRRLAWEGFAIRYSTDYWHQALYRVKDNLLGYSDAGFFPGDTRLHAKLPPVEGEIGHAWVIDMNQQTFTYYEGLQFEQHDEGIFACVSGQSQEPRLCQPCRPRIVMRWDDLEEDGEWQLERIRQRNW